MKINRAELKRHARSCIIRETDKGRMINIGLLAVSLAYIALSVLIYLLVAKLLGVNYTETGLELYQEYLRSGNLEYAAAVAMEMSPPFYATVLDWLSSLVLYVVGAGYIIYLLNTIRGAGVCLGNLLDAFPLFFKIFLLNLLSGIFIFLWSLLLIVPGIIAAYRYRLAIYILVDHPEKSALQCIRESKQLMRGHKWELFVLDLSFLGWSILALLPYVGYLVQLWTVPYLGLSYALYYEKLSGSHISFDDSGYSVPTPPLDR